MDRVASFVADIKSSLNCKMICNVARDIGFINRKRKFGGYNFLISVVEAATVNQKMTLLDIQDALLNHGISISRVGIKKRVNEKCVQFFKTIFERVAQKLLGIHNISKDMSRFADIYIHDATEVKVNKKLLSLYPSTRNQARCKLQTSISLTHHLFQCDITPANQNDQSYDKYIDNVKEGGLVVCDLGYYCQAKLVTIATTKKAYYISRLKKGMRIAIDSKGVDLNIWLAALQEQEFSIEIMLGVDHPMKCRLVGKKLEVDNLNKRENTIRKAIKKKGSKRKKDADDYVLQEVDKWSLYITNIEDYTPPQIHNLYRLRWQIELLFKVMKSHFNLDKLHGKDKQNNNMLLVCLYAKLIALTLLISISAQVTEISLYKAAKLYIRDFKHILKWITSGYTQKIKLLLKKLQQLYQKSCYKKRPTTQVLCGLHEQRISS